MKISKIITLILLLVFCISSALPYSYSFANSKPFSKEDQLKEEIDILIRMWQQCKKDKGEAHPDCEKIFRDLMQKVEELLELLKFKYNTNCGGEKASSEYCKNLADRIARILEWVYNEICTGKMANTEFCEELKKEIEEWKKRAKTKGQSQNMEKGATNNNQTPYSGVYIDPKPSKAGKGGSDTKEKVIKSRPSDDALYWEVK